MIVTGAWWDLVDDLSAHLVGGVLAGYPDETAPVVRRGRPTRALAPAYVGHLPVLRGAETDLDLLTCAIERDLDDTSFWLRKAIGWSLVSTPGSKPPGCRVRRRRVTRSLSRRETAP